MKNTKSLGMLAAVVFAVGFVGFNFSSGQMNTNENMLATMDGGYVSGHIEVIHTDKDGNVLTYLQTDNAIMNEGRNCAAKALFGSAANTACTDTTPIFNVIGVGNGTFAGDNDSTTLQSEVTGNGLTRTDGTGITLSQQQSASGASGTSSIARISNTFTLSGHGTDSTMDVNEAGLFNATSSGNDLAFALKNFPSTVSMSNDDQLTVNWDITISGSDGIGP